MQTAAPGSRTGTKTRGSSRTALSPTASRLIRALVLILVGLTITVGSATSDAYLHRGGTEESATIYRQPTGQALATNIDLRGTSTTELQTAIGFLTDSGYRYVRQDVYWSDIQPTPDTFDWSVYDTILQALDQNNIVPVLVLRGTPSWARLPQNLAYADSPPFSAELFETFCAALRERFPTLTYFQIGANLDNPEFWGGSTLRSNVYRQLLEAASSGLDVAATDSILMSGEVGYDPAIRAAGGDLAMIQRLFADPDVRALVRVASVAVDGGSRSPYDRSADVATDSLSRLVLIREALDLTGAVETPVWITHFGWTGDGGEGLSLDDQARFVSSGLIRVRSEWPWVGLIFNWAYNSESAPDVNPNLALVVNGAATPLLGRMADYGKSVRGTSITNGFVPPDTESCTYSGNWQDQHLREGIYRTVRDKSAFVTCRFWGTGISAFFRFSPDSGTARFVVDQDSLPPPGEGTGVGVIGLTFRVDDAIEAPVQLVSGLPEGLHTVTIGLDDSGELVIGGFLVARERPMIWPIAVLVAAGLVSLFLGLRSIAMVAAEHVGMIDARTDELRETPLPTVPNWTPSPRLRGR